MSLVMVGILNWNQKEDTLRCLESLKQVWEPEIKIVVVDNGSSDGSAEVIQARFPEVTILENSFNNGCAGGRNDFLIFFLQSNAEYGMFLDNDATVTPDCFKILIEEANRSPEIGVLGVKAYYDNQKNVFWSRGGGILNPWKGTFEKAGTHEVDQGQYPRSEEVDSVPGGFTFFKRTVAEKVPKIEERYFIYFEDSDWCFQVKKAGFKLMTSARACVYHKNSSSLGMESPLFYYYRTRNKILFMIRNAPSHLLFFFIRFFAYDLPDLTIMLWRSKKPEQIKAVFSGVYDFFAGNWYACDRQFSLKGE